ncbi:MAG: phosphoglucosamine mutase [bacterium]
METKPKLTVSGYRGIWEKDLDESIAFEYALSFARMIKENNTNESKTILIGRDARKTGINILNAIESALKKEELEAKYIGIIPTPSVLLLVKKLSNLGGIIITASHNPKEYNGLKFVLNTGLFATQKEIEEIEKIKENLTEEEKKYDENNETKNEEVDNKKFIEIHISEILKNIDVDLIKSKNFKVALDPINSAGSIIAQEFLKELGCEVFVINGEQNGEFAHEPEPILKNLKDIGEAVLKSNSNIGFAQDPDADRLVIINEKGEVLSEEYTLALAVKNVLSKEKSDVVVNMSTSRICEDIANSYEREIFRTKIGEANVVEKMLEENAVIGGEGNGGVIYAKVHPCRDSITGMGLILELMARESKTVSEITDNLPKYIMKKDKIVFSKDLIQPYWKLKNEFHDASINTKDGVRFDWTDYSWIHIRPSNTEPIIRIIGEAKTANRIESLFNKVKLTLGQ